ncbi:MAG: hypothetical protein AAF432_15245 [Planctomycetota bacterium]
MGTMPRQDDHGLDRGFETTSWTLVGLLDGHEGSERREDALATLSERYWPPVYAYLRRTGSSSDEAAEITQGFFTDVIFTRQLFQKANRDRARLRVLILSALKNYKIDRHRHETAGVRKLTLTGADVSEQEATLPTSDQLPPERVFDQHWATRVLQDALGRCEAHYRTSGKSGHWDAYVGQVLHPSLHNTEAKPLEEVAAALGFSNANAVASALHVVKKRLMALLREVISESMTNDDEIDAEFDYLCSLLQG